MAYQKLQVSDGLVVIPSDTVPIPDPTTAIVLDATTTGATVGDADFNTGGTLLDTTPGIKFTEAGVKVGDIVYQTGTNVAYTVTEVVNDEQLSITPSAAAGAGLKNYSIYSAATVGCILYVGTGGALTVDMAARNGNMANQPANEKLRFVNLPNASFMPTQVVRVRATGTSASDIIALW